MIRGSVVLWEYLYIALTLRMKIWFHILSVKKDEKSCIMWETKNGIGTVITTLTVLEIDSAAISKNGSNKKNPR